MSSTPSSSREALWWEGREGGAVSANHEEVSVRCVQFVRGEAAEAPRLPGVFVRSGEAANHESELTSLAAAH